MPRTIVKAVLCVLTLLIVTASPACSAKPVKPEKPANADVITEGLLQAINKDDYTGYISYYAEDVRKYMTSSLEISAQEFDAQSAIIKGELGEYEADSLKYWKTEKEDSYISVYYKAKCTIDSVVMVKSVFKEIKGEVKLVGFWLFPD